MFPCFLSIYAWNGTGWGVYANVGPVRKMNYLNSIISENVCCQRFSCAVPLFLAETFLPWLAIILLNFVQDFASK